MIESDKEFGTFEIFCDEIGCGESQEYDTDGDWSEFISEAKLDGWKIYKKDKDWYHKCPRCAGG